MLALLTLLLLVPVAVRYWSKLHRPAVSWMLTGAALGVVISPVSMGLYSTYFLGPWFIVTGLPGLLLMIFHGSPGFYFCQWTGLLKPGVVSGSGHILVEVANGVIWAAVYGGLGAALDRRNLARPAL